MTNRLPAALAALLLIGCGGERPPAAIDPGLLNEIAAIRAIDNHAHPVRVTAAGEQPDRGFDALPVDNMEPQSDPVNFRPGSPAFAAAPREMYSGMSKADTIKA